MHVGCGDLSFGQLCGFLEDHTGGHGVIGPVTSRALYALIVLVAIIAGGRLLRRLTLRALDRARVDTQVRTLVNNVFMGTTVAVAIFGSVIAGGINASYLLTFGGVASLAVGLAFQDLLRNVLAGIFLLVERPFRIGDLISVGDLSGTVQTIELRTTALRTGDGRLAVMPNLSAFNGTVINANAYDTRQFTVNVWAAADADLEKVLAALRAELESTHGLLDHPAPRVQPSVGAEGDVTVSCSYWLEYRSVDPDAIAADLVRRLHAAARGAGGSGGSGASDRPVSDGP